MNTVRHPLSLALATLLVALPASSAPTAGPPTQVWIDVATHDIAGMPDLGAMGGMAGFAGKMMGGKADAGSRLYPQAQRPALAGKLFDVALYNRLKPGLEAQQSIPAGLGLGKSLTLLPPTSNPDGRRDDPSQTEDVEMTIHEYWGCGAGVRKGQPNTFKVKVKGGQVQTEGSMAKGRYAPDRDIDTGPAYALWPNRKSGQRVGSNASLTGQHHITGDGVPASLTFQLGQSADFMPKIALNHSGGLADAVPVTWQPVDRARAYFLHAFAMRDPRTVVLWSSAEVAGVGDGIVNYLTGSQIDKWLKEKLLLPASTGSCTIPQGIFNGTGEGAGMAPLNMIAYGPETNITWPERPADPKQPWNPEWNVRIRTKSTSTAILGMDMSGMDDDAQPGQDSQPPEEDEGVGKKLLKGLLKRGL